MSRAQGDRAHGVGRSGAGDLRSGRDHRGDRLSNLGRMASQEEKRPLVSPFPRARWVATAVLAA